MSVIFLFPFMAIQIQSESPFKAQNNIKTTSQSQSFLDCISLQYIRLLILLHLGQELLDCLSKASLTCLLCTIPSYFSFSVRSSTHQDSHPSTMSSPSRNFQPHPQLQSDVPFQEGVDHGIMSVSSSSDPSQDVHYWVTNLLVLKAFHADCLAADNDTFYSTPFSSKNLWDHGRPQYPIFTEEVTILKSNPLESTTSKRTSSQLATIYKHTTHMWLHPAPRSHIISFHLLRYCAPLRKSLQLVPGFNWHPFNIQSLEMVYQCQLLQLTCQPYLNISCTIRPHNKHCFWPILYQLHHLLLPQESRHQQEK